MEFKFVKRKIEDLIAFLSLATNRKLMGSDDFKEAAAAFLQKRKPVFKGK